MTDINCKSERKPLRSSRLFGCQRKFFSKRTAPRKGIQMNKLDATMIY